MRPLRTFTLAGIAAGVFALSQARSYRLGHILVRTGRDFPTLRILHLSDTHLWDRRRTLYRWLCSLPETVGKVDLVIVTGDFVDDDSGVDLAVDALDNLEARLGRFYVLGSHDYYASTLRGLVAALSKLYAAKRKPETSRPIDTPRLEAGLKASGWISLANAVETIETTHGTIRLAGVDDPFLKRHEIENIRRAPDDTFAIGVVHCPDIVSEFVLNGFDLVLGGHTHGGQICAPGGRAIVTNCTLPRPLARGHHRIGSSHLHVSPGLGTGKFVPVRMFCPPEATVLEITPG